MLDFVAAVPIETKTASRELTIVVAGADELDQAFKTAERRRRIGVQIENDLVMRHLGVLARDHHRGFGRDRVMSREMRSESDCLISPQQFLKFFRSLFIRRIDDDTQLLLDDLGDEPAGNLQLGFGV